MTRTSERKSYDDESCEIHTWNKLQLNPERETSTNNGMTKRRTILKQGLRC